MLKRSDLTRSDRIHLREWIKNHDLSGDDSIWERIVVDAQGEPARVYSDIISYALDARRIAEAVKRGDDPFRKERQQRRDELLQLAQKSDDLAKHYHAVERYSGIAMFFQRFLLPVRSLWMLHEYEAELLRQIAGREPLPTTFISRQSGGQGKRARSREIMAFMCFLADRMREECGKSYHDVVAEMTNAAFPKADVTADDVRSAMKAARRRLQVHSEAKKVRECTAVDPLSHEINAHCNCRRMAANHEVCDELNLRRS